MRKVNLEVILNLTKMSSGEKDRESGVSAYSLSV